MMKVRLAAAVVVTLGLSVLACGKTDADRGAGVASSTVAPLPTVQFVPGDVDAIVLKPADKPETRLERRDGTWTIAGKPAKQDAIEKLLGDLQGVTIGDAIATDATAYEPNGVTPEKAVHVVASRSGEPVLDIYIGKAGPRGQAVRMASDPRVFSAKGLSPYLYDRAPDAFEALDQAKSAEACKVGDVAHCEVACGSGDNGSCLKVGQLRLKSDDDVVKSKAVEPLKKACASGLGRACAELGGALFKLRTKEIGALNLMKDKAKQLEIKDEQASLVAKGCELNDGLACAQLAGWYGEGYGVQKDVAKANTFAKKAVGLFEKECNAGDTSSCTGLGYLYVGGKNGVPKDKAKAVKLFKQACDAKEELACTGLKEFG